MNTPTLPPRIVDGLVVAPYVAPPLPVIQPGLTVEQHITDVVGVKLAHQFGVCCCPWWHAYDASRHRWMVERTCGSTRIVASHEPVRAHQATWRGAEDHAARLAERLNAVYKVRAAWNHWQSMA